MCGNWSVVLDWMWFSVWIWGKFYANNFVFLKWLSLVLLVAYLDIKSDKQINEVVFRFCSNFLEDFDSFMPLNYPTWSLVYETILFIWDKVLQAGNCHAQTANAHLVESKNRNWLLPYFSHKIKVFLCKKQWSTPSYINHFWSMTYEPNLLFKIAAQCIEYCKKTTLKPQDLQCVIEMKQKVCFCF